MVSMYKSVHSEMAPFYSHTRSPTCRRGFGRAANADPFPNKVSGLAVRRRAPCVTRIPTLTRRTTVTPAFSGRSEAEVGRAAADWATGGTFSPPCLLHQTAPDAIQALAHGLGSEENGPVPYVPSSRDSRTVAAILDGSPPSLSANCGFAEQLRVVFDHLRRHARAAAGP